MTLSAAQRRYILLETIISMALGALFSMLMAYAVFHGDGMVDAGGAKMQFDVLPQTFATAFMSVAVPTFLTRRRCLSGAVPTRVRGATRWPRHLLLRGIAFGLVAMVAGGALGAVVLPLWAGVLLDLPTLLAWKGVWGAVVALIITPAAIGLALGDHHGAAPAFD